MICGASLNVSCLELCASVDSKKFRGILNQRLDLQSASQRKAKRRVTYKVAGTTALLHANIPSNVPRQILELMHALFRVEAEDVISTSVYLPVT